MLPGLLLSETANAGLWDDLWQRRDQQAQEALQAKDAEAAAGLAENPEITGEAWYRAGEYQRAEQAWAQRPTADTHYNRGNAFARAGDFDNAIAAYDAALELNPEMEDALFNRALVEELKEQQEQQEQQQQQQEGEGESQEQQQQQDQDEDAQAMEQWLRRIPDDPGGLLRRKFRNQHMRRGAPADEEKTW